MYEKMLALLTAKFAQARKDGLQQLARSLAIQTLNETEAQALVETLQETQVTDFIKVWRKEVDSEVSKGTRSFEENLKGKYDLVEKKNPTKPNVDTDPKDIAAVVANAVSAALKPLQDKIAHMESGKTSETRKEVLIGKLANAPEAFKNTILKNFDKMSFESQEDFDEFVTETEVDARTMEQTLANDGLNNFPTPSGSTPAAVEKAAGDDIAKWAEGEKNSSN